MKMSSKILAIIFLFCTVLVYGQEGSQENLEGFKNIEEGGLIPNVFRIVVMLVFIIVLIVGVSYGAKKLSLARISLANDKSTIKIISQRALSQKSIVYIVEIDSQKIVLGESSGGISVITIL